jgi:signal transduction histidine kinase
MKAKLLDPFESRVQDLFTHKYGIVTKKTDELFSYLLLFQWILAIVFAEWLSPKAWSGNQSQIHIHVYAAVILGGLLSCYPIYLIRRAPGATINRMTIAVAQMLYSILFIHLTGGRIETHFHIFGSLAFLAFYRDWRVLAIATAITAADHFLRGMFWPESIYGVLSATPWRAVEHSLWVGFEDIILLYSIRPALSELWTLAERRATIESVVTDQQIALIASAKLSSLGEMAGGIAHEINTPLAIILLRVEQLEDGIIAGEFNELETMETLEIIKKTTQRIGRIVQGLKALSRDGKAANPEVTSIATMIEDTLALCHERFRNHGVKLEVLKNESYLKSEVECRSVEISQVLLNLLNNAYDAIETVEDGWVRIEVKESGETIDISVTDSGPGIPSAVKDKLMQPFFTTKMVGKGTGLGLSISKGIAESHHGNLFIDDQCANTKFVLRLPKLQITTEEKSA